MIQTISFVGSDQNSQAACNEASRKANTFLRDFSISREQLVSTNINYQVLFSMELGSGYSECVVTLVVDTPYTIIDLFTVEAPEQDDFDPNSQDEPDHTSELPFDEFPFEGYA